MAAPKAAPKNQSSFTAMLGDGLIVKVNPSKACEVKEVISQTLPEYLKKLKTASIQFGPELPVVPACFILDNGIVHLLDKDLNYLPIPVELFQEDVKV